MGWGVSPNHLVRGSLFMKKDRSAWGIVGYRCSKSVPPTIHIGAKKKSAPGAKPAKNQKKRTRAPQPREARVLGRGSILGMAVQSLPRQSEG